MNNEILYRSTAITESNAINEEERTVELAFSSEQPVERIFGNEVLDHSPESVDLSRMNDGAPLLLEHDRTNQIGVVDVARVDDDKVGRAVVRFSKSAAAQEIFQDVKDGIRRLVSVGYSVARFAKEKSEEGLETVRAVDWQPMEISLVSIPADQSVGVGRTAEESKPTQVEESIIQNMNEKSEVIEETVQTENAINETPEVRVEVRTDHRSEEIAALGRQFDASSEAVEFIGEGKSADEFKTYLIERNANASKVIEKGDDEIGMGNTEVKEYSLRRAILQASEGKLDGIELEASEELEKRFGEPAKGFYVPNDIWRGKRDLTASGGDTGDNLVTENLQDYIPALSAAPIVVQMGARVLSGLSSNVAIPKGGSMTAAWLTENADTAESTMTLSQLTLSPKRVSALGELSKQLLVQASYDVENIVRDDILLQLSLAIDSAAISGDGTGGAPTGILSTATLGNTFSSAFTHAGIVDLETDVGEANALRGNLGYLVRPSGVGSLKQITLDSGSGRFLMEGDTLNGYKVGVTTQCPADHMFFGDWSQLIVAEFGAGADIIVDPYTKATTGLTRIHVQRFADVGVRQANAFAVTS
jgi:HK97 family phage major capsid protein/HK97 family phage prohead protease